MAKYSAIKAAVNAYIKANGRKEITGSILNAVLNATIDSLGKYFQFAGVATPLTNPENPDQNVCYLAGEPGTYTNFDNIVLENEEIALLFFDGTWSKQRMLLGIQEVIATVDNTVGTPSVDVEYSEGQLELNFHNIKGQKGDTGDAAGFGTIGATIDGNIGTPGVSVQESGPATAKNLVFNFTNLKGETGVTSVVATVDNATGTPTCEVSLVGQQLTLAFHNLKGAQGNTGSSVDYPFEIVNNLTTNDPTKALSAAQGVALEGEIGELEAKVDDLSTGKYYGYFSKEEDLPEADVDGFAYVGEGPTYTIYNLRGGVWTSSDITVNQSPIGNDEDIDQNEDGKLQFANRVYNAQQPNGMGYKILRKDASFASQVTDTNTIYEIRYPFVLSADFTMPANCVLYFNGGNISGSHYLQGNGTTISGNLVNILDGVVLSGAYTNTSCDLSWWGCSTRTGFDNSAKIESALDSTIRRIVVNGVYGISNPVNISKRAHFIVGSSIGGFKQNGFVANDDFSAINVTLRDDVTYTVTGMFYHSFDQAADISNIFIDAKWRAKYGIEHVAGYSSPSLENLYIQHAKIAGILQYACEKPIWKHIYISECFVGLYISSHRIDESDVIGTNGTRIGVPNLATLYDCRAVSCNYGMIIYGGSNTSLDNCETAYNSVAGLVVNGTIFLKNFYTEGDGNCAFFWNEDGTKEQNSDGNGYTPTSVVSENKDGFLITTDTQVYGGSIYFRAPIVVRGGNLSVSNSFISIKPRSHQLSDVTTVEYPTERTATGVDCAFLLINARAVEILGENVIYRLSNDTGKYPYHLVVFGNTNNSTPLPKITFDYVALLFTNDPLFCANNVACGAFSTYNRVGSNDYNRFDQRLVSSHRGKSFLWLSEFAKYGALAQNTKFDFRVNRFIEIYKGIPLYKRDTTKSNYNGFYFAKTQLEELFGNESQIKIRVIIHNPAQQTTRAVIQASFYNASYTIVKSYSNDSSGAVQIEPGYFELTFVVPVKYLADDTWDKVRYSISITDESTIDIYVSDLLLYGVSEKENPPIMSSYVLQSGTTANRPNANPGQVFFDTTLGKSIVWNGSSWTNMDGTALS